MNDTLNTTTLDLNLSPQKVTGETTTIVEHKSSYWNELEALLLELSQADKGVDYADEWVETLTWGKNTALGQDQTYTTKDGHRGFNWLNTKGKYSCTKNADENKLYVGFQSWDAIKARKQDF